MKARRSKPLNNRYSNAADQSKSTLTLYCRSFTNPFASYPHAFEVNAFLEDGTREGYLEESVDISKALALLKVEKKVISFIRGENWRTGRVVPQTVVQVRHRVVYFSVVLMSMFSCEICLWCCCFVSGTRQRPGR